MTDIRTDQATDDLEEFCTICKREIRYESPENFDPVCMDDDGDVHCEECCLCSMMTVNVGDLCTHCGRDTSFGNGMFVNRIPSGADGRLILDSGGKDVTVDVMLEGWMCPDCQDN